MDSKALRGGSFFSALLLVVVAASEFSEFGAWLASFT